jgi:galactokinase
VGAVSRRLDGGEPRSGGGGFAVAGAGIGERAFRAPGRVNLIGEHTDYNDGFVLPLAIDLECTVRSRPRPDGIVTGRSRDVAGELELPADGSAEPGDVRGWGRHAAGLARALAARGRPPTGLDVTVSSSVPVGAGLSSSAALEVALALALCDAAGFELPPLELALACQESERMATGVPGGIMDQLASICGRAGCALLIDCRSLEIEPIPLPDELAVVVVHSGLTRSLGGTAYAERRAECERVAAELGLRALRDATPEQVAHSPRARHVVSENERVLEAVHALRARDADHVGELMSASHGSLRDDYEVSTPELDALVAALDEAGALGARLTGAGFGGCVVTLADRERADEIAQEACERYRAEKGREPTPFVVRAAAGAGPA